MISTGARDGSFSVKASETALWDWPNTVWEGRSSSLDPRCHHPISEGALQAHALTRQKERLGNSRSAGSRCPSLVTSDSGIQWYASNSSRCRQLRFIVEAISRENFKPTRRSHSFSSCEGWRSWRGRLGEYQEAQGGSRPSWQDQSEKHGIGTEAPHP